MGRLHAGQAKCNIGGHYFENNTELCKYTKKRIEKKITKWRRDKTRGLGTHFFKRLYAKKQQNIKQNRRKKKCLILDIHEHNLLDVSLTD